MPEPADSAERKRWMSVLARARADEIGALLQEPPPHTRLRGPETGLVMLRGRAGGGGSPFNMGEMTVTRCTVRLADGNVGHAYVAGRDGKQAELAALVDAMLQDEAVRPAILRTVIEPLATRQQARRDAIARKAAATRVQFFTMATMRS